MAGLKPTTSRVIVNLAGTAVAINSARLAHSVLIQALGSNTGSIFVGDSNVTNLNGIELSPGESISFDNTSQGGTNRDFRLDQIYINADIGGDGVIVMFEERIDP